MFFYTPHTFTHTPYTFTVTGDSGKKQKSPEKTGAIKQKKTETPRLRDFGWFDRLAKDSTQGSPGFQVRTSATISISKTMMVVNKKSTTVLY